MPAEILVPKCNITGKVRGYRVPEGAASIKDWQKICNFKHNEVLYEWGAIVGNLLLRKGLNYGIAGMYIEFENVASPETEVTVPDFDRSTESGVEYYNGLSVSSDRDYLRVPLIAGTLASDDEELYPNGNLVTFFAQTAGTEGVHGKAFANGSNSKVFGAALAAFPAVGDPTQDLIFSRFYFDPSEQITKLASSQIGLEWALSLL